jgi:hypothetical protein
MESHSVAAKRGFLTLSARAPKVIPVHPGERRLEQMNVSVASSVFLT